MANDIANRGSLTIDSPTAGNKVLRKVKSYDITDNSDLEHAFECGGDAPAGFIAKPGGCEITLDVYHEAGSPEVDWELIKRRQEIFILTRTMKPSGQRLQWSRCRVASVSSDGDEQGSHMMKVKILANAPEAL